MPYKQWNAPLGITKEQWMSLLRNEEIITEKDLQLLKAIYRFDGCKATSVELALLLGMSASGRPLNLRAGKLGRRILNELNIWDKLPEGWGLFNVPFTSEEGEKAYWILRLELRDAMRELYEGEASLPEIPIPEEIASDSYENLYEGAKKQVYVNVYERNRDARDKCVKHYGVRCIICTFDFEKWYGEVGRDVIHVHHLKPLAEIGEKYQVDPINDLRPVCPNCHVIIHKRNPPYTIDEVKAMMRNARTK